MNSKEKHELDVYSYHWDIKKEPITSQSPDKIYSWCLDQKSFPYLLRFENQRISFHLKLPEFVSNQRIDWVNNYKKVINHIQYKIKTHRTLTSRLAKLVGYEFNHKRMLCLYEGKKLYPVLTLYFNNTANMYVIAKLFNYDVSIKGIGMETVKTAKNGRRYRSPPSARYECLEKGINIVRRMLTRYDCGYCQWFTTLGNKVSPENKVSTLEREYIITSHIKPLPDTTTLSWKGNPGVFTFDIETLVDNDFEWPKEFFYGHYIFSISCMYQRYQEGKPKIVNMIVANHADPPEGEEVRVYKTEKALLTDFFNLIAEMDPEIITGYNTYGFDNEYLWKRTLMKQVKVNPKASRLLFFPVIFNENDWQSKGYGHNSIKQIEMGGRIDVDVIMHVRKNYKLKNNKLDTAAKAILRKGKYDLPYRKMFADYDYYTESQFLKDHPAFLEYNNEWKKRGTIEEITTKAQQKLNSIVKYNSVDTVITYEIFEKVGLYTGNRELCNIVGINIQDVLNRGQQMRGVSTIYNECQGKGIIMNKIDFDSDMEFMGGRVFEPILGLWDDVICIDFSSLYPSIIVSLNLCYSTIIPEERWGEIPEGKYTKIEWTEEKSGIKREYRYVTAEVREGILPALLKKLLAGRSKVKKAMALEKDPLIKSVLNKKQLAVKVCANSIYGLTGISQAMGKLPLKPLSCSVTASGRKFITMSAEYVEEKYGATVIYGDTDSIMFRIPGVEGGKICVSEGHRMAKEVSKIYPGIIKFEFEKAGRLLPMTKKKYVYWKYDDYKKLRNGELNPRYGELTDLDNDPNAMELRGNILVRRDNCEWYKDMYRELLYNILRKKGIKIAYEQMLKRIVKLVLGKIDYEDLVIYGAMGSNYKEKTYKIAVFKAGLEKRGRYLAPGERFGFVVVKLDLKEGEKYYMGNAMRLVEEYEEMKEKGKTMEIDIGYYFKLIAAKNLDQLFNGGYNNVLKPVMRRMKEVKYNKILNEIERYDEGGIVDDMLEGNGVKGSKLEKKVEVYMELNEFSKTVNRDSSDEEKKMKKGIENARKTYLTGRGVFKTDLNFIVKTLYTAYLKGKFWEVYKNINWLLSQFK